MSAWEKPNRITVTLDVEIHGDDVERAREAAMDFQDQLRDEWRGRAVGCLQINDVVGIIVQWEEPGPLIGAIMQALVDRGWRIEGNTRKMVDPDGEHYTLPAAIDVQTFREIAEMS